MGAIAGMVGGAAGGGAAGGGGGGKGQTSQNAPGINIINNSRMTSVWARKAWMEELARVNEERHRMMT